MGKGYSLTGKTADRARFKARKFINSVHVNTKRNARTIWTWKTGDFWTTRVDVCGSESKRIEQIYQAIESEE